MLRPTSLSDPLSLPRVAVLFILAVTLNINGCITPPQGSIIGSTPSRGDSRAAGLEAQGDFLAAAVAYESLANAAKAPLRQEYQLSAAMAWLRAGEVAKARAQVEGIDTRGLDARLLTRRQVVDARVALSEANPGAALRALENIVPDRSPTELRAEIHLLRAEAYLLLGRPFDAARERVVLDGLLADAAAVNDNQLALLQALAQLPEADLAEVARSADALGGWAELTLIVRRAGGEPERLSQEIAKWRQRYRAHPATEPLLAFLRERPQELLAGSAVAERDIGVPQRIALLLPLSGSLGGVGAAVRDGFMAAANASQSSAQDIRIYDVGVSNAKEEAGKVTQVYQDALREGADFVVGPLQKEGVSALYALQAPVPTLALNYSEKRDTPPANLYQFGLAPEDEARQAAERAWLEGHSRALVLTPDGEWGARVYRAFSDYLEQLGGIIVEAQTYPPEEVDFSAPVRDLLDYRGEGSRRRQDADYLFLAAFPRQARGILPQLHYFYAAGLPVYATSHVYGLPADPAADIDLNGVHFADMPWVLSAAAPRLALRRELAAQTGADFQSLKRLYALGADAYDLIAQIDRLRAAPGERFAGGTGTLSIDEMNRVHRHLEWARFEGGEARALESTLVNPPQ